MGPLSSQELRRLVEQGVVTPQTPVSADRVTWHAAITLRGLFPRTVPAATAPKTSVPPAAASVSGQQGSAAAVKPATLKQAVPLDRRNVAGGLAIAKELSRIPIAEAAFETSWPTDSKPSTVARKKRNPGWIVGAIAGIGAACCLVVVISFLMARKDRQPLQVGTETQVSGAGGKPREPQNTDVTVHSSEILRQARAAAVAQLDKTPKKQVYGKNDSANTLSASPSFLCRIAAAQVKEGNTREAIDTLNEFQVPEMATLFGIHSRETWIAIVAAQVEHGDTEAALRTAERFSNDQNGTEILAGLGEARGKAKKPDLANAAFHKARQLAGDYVQRLAVLAGCAVRGGNSELAKEILDFVRREESKDDKFSYLSEDQILEALAIDAYQRDDEESATSYMRDIRGDLFKDSARREMVAFFGRKGQVHTEYLNDGIAFAVAKTIASKHIRTAAFAEVACYYAKAGQTDAAQRIFSQSQS